MLSNSHLHHRVSRHFIVNVALAGFFLVLVGASAEAATRTVCATGCDYSQIRFAVDDAASGDVILVGEGLYAEHIVIAKDITLQGVDAATTIIEGFDFRSVIKIDGAHTVIVNDLTVTGGRGSSGAGVDNHGGIVSLNRCVVSNNVASSFGGGLFNLYGSILNVNHSEIHDNHGGNGTAPDFGGGIYNRGTLTISYSSIRDNSTFTQGGAVWTWGPTTITHSTMTGNRANDRGGAIFTKGAVLSKNTNVPKILAFRRFRTDGDWARPSVVG